MVARLEREDGLSTFTVYERSGEGVESAAFVGGDALRRARQYALAVYGVWVEPPDLGFGPAVFAALGGGAAAGGAAGRDAAVVAR